MKSDLPYLGHIADSIAAIESYVAEGRAAFMAQRLIQDAVVRNFEVVGEAAKAHSVRLESAGRNVPCETSISCARDPDQMEPLAVPSDRDPL